MHPLAHEAVKAALNCDWDSAVSLNKKILHDDSEDISALLRLSNALLETGHVKDAQKYAKKAQKIDPTAPLVRKCLERCSSPLEKSDKKIKNSRKNLKAFLETPGKTHLVKLIRLGEPKVIMQLHPGDSLSLNISPHKVLVETEDGTHIGHLPDDIAAKFRNTRKDRFWAAVKNVKPNEVSVLIHES